MLHRNLAFIALGLMLGLFGLRPSALCAEAPSVAMPALNGTFSGRVISIGPVYAQPAVLTGSAQAEPAVKPSAASPGYLPGVAGAAVTIRRIAVWTELAQQPGERRPSKGAPVVEAAMVQLTDSSGRFQFKGLWIGQYEYSVTHPGYTPMRGTFLISVGQPNASVTVNLNPLPPPPPVEKKALKGRVLYQGPFPVPWQGATPVSASTEPTASTSPAAASSSRWLRRFQPVAGARVTLSTAGPVPLPAPEPPTLMAITAPAPATAPEETAASAEASTPVTASGASAAGSPTPQIMPPRPRPILVTTTDLRGRFEFNNVDGRLFILTIEKEGYPRHIEYVTLDAPITRKVVIITPTGYAPSDPVVPAVPVKAQDGGAATETPSASGSVENPFGQE